MDSAVVRVDFAPVASDSFRVAGFRRGGRFDLAGRVETWGWGGPYVIADFPLEEWPDGRATGLRGVLTRVLAFIEDLHLAEVTNSDIEVLELCYEGRDDDDDGDDDAEPETEE